MEEKYYSASVTFVRFYCTEQKSTLQKEAASCGIPVFMLDMHSAMTLTISRKLKKLKQIKAAMLCS